MMMGWVSHFCAAQDTVTFNRTYDFNHGYETGTSVIALDDGYLVCASGYATEYDGWRALKLLKTDFEGNEIWRKVYGIETKGLTSGWYGSLTKLENGYFLAAALIDSGNLDSKGVLYRFDEAGDTIWTRVYDKPGYSFFNSGRQTLSKDFVAIGVQYVSGIRQYWLVKTDSLGITKLDTTLGVGYASTIEITQDGGYVIGGAGGNFLSTARIVKTDSLGNIEWSRQHFGGNQEGCYWSAGLASDGGYYIWGCYDTIINPTDFFLTPILAKLDNNGNRLWTNFYNNPNQRLTSVFQVKELPNGNIVLGGERDDDNPLLASGGWIIKMDNAGNTIWEKIHASTEDSTFILGANSINDFALTSDGGTIITGYGFTDIDPGPNYNGSQDIWLLKLDSLGNWYAPPDTACPPPCDTVGITETPTLQAKLYPNPTTGKLTVELPNEQDGNIELYNLLGQSVFNATINGTATIQTELPQGVYIYRITQGGLSKMGRLVVE